LGPWGRGSDGSTVETSSSSRSFSSLTELQHLIKLEATIWSETFWYSVGQVYTGEPWNQQLCLTHNRRYGQLSRVRSRLLSHFAAYLLPLDAFTPLYLHHFDADSTPNPFRNPSNTSSPFGVKPPCSHSQSSSLPSRIN
jgi:hypothetical protein